MQAVSTKAYYLKLGQNKMKICYLSFLYTSQRAFQKVVVQTVQGNCICQQLMKSFS